MSLILLRPGKHTEKTRFGLVWRNRKKISQIIKDYYLPVFLLIILWVDQYFLKDKNVNEASGAEASCCCFALAAAAVQKHWNVRVMGQIDW
jgi:hypothetical protein